MAQAMARRLPDGRWEAAPIADQPGASAGGGAGGLGLPGHARRARRRAGLLVRAALPEWAR